MVIRRWFSCLGARASRKAPALPQKGKQHRAASCSANPNGERQKQKETTTNTNKKQMCVSTYMCMCMLFVHLVFMEKNSVYIYICVCCVYAYILYVHIHIRPAATSAGNSGMSIARAPRGYPKKTLVGPNLPQVVLNYWKSSLKVESRTRPTTWKASDLSVWVTFHQLSATLA